MTEGKGMYRRCKEYFLVYCAWCRHGDGDTCTHASSPPNTRSHSRYAPGDCAPVCCGDI